MLNLNKKNKNWLFTIILDIIMLIMIVIALCIKEDTSSTKTLAIILIVGMIGRYIIGFIKYKKDK